MKADKLKSKVDNFKTEYPQGFIQSEITELLKDYPDINMDKFNDAMYGNTCMVIDNKIVTYHCDVELALRCGIENRDMKVDEWD